MVTATTPRAGQYFNVKRDGRYINAQIVRNASHKKVQVMYLDTGNTSYVFLHDLWSLKGPRLAALKKKLEKEKKEKKEKKESTPTLPVPVPYAPSQELSQQDVPQDISQEQPVYRRLAQSGSSRLATSRGRSWATLAACSKTRCTQPRG